MQPNGGAEGPVLNIIGEKVALGPLRRDLVPLYAKWMNDFEVTRTLSYGFRPTTLEAEEAWYERASHGATAVFTIYERATLRPIGNTDIGEIDYQHGSAPFGLMIGEKDCWGKGYGTEATTLMLDYAFTALGLHSVMLWVYSFNERGIRVPPRRLPGVRPPPGGTASRRPVVRHRADGLPEHRVPGLDPSQAAAGGLSAGPLELPGAPRVTGTVDERPRERPHGALCYMDQRRARGRPHVG